LKYRWILSHISDEHAVQQVARSINVSPTVARILVARGITTFDQAREFFRPSLADLHDPFLMDGMDRAVERSLRAVEQGEPIAIYGDYDVDGTSSAAMLTLYFRSLGANVRYYIPDRFTEGYGVSTVGIDRLVAEGVKLIITIDCGITAVEQVLYARERGVDVIICDHHEPGSSLPEAYAVLDPIKGGCNYPFKHLSGCGVGFKLIQGIAQHLGDTTPVYEYLDFVAIAAAADIVPLVGENRVLVSHGLRKLNDSPRPGIRGLLECAGMRKSSLGTSNIVFGLAPRINAAGRLGDAGRAVEMMIEEDEVRAFQLAQELETQNRERRLIDEETFQQATLQAEQMVAAGPVRSLVLYSPHWHAGVIGIVASRIVERFYLPTVLLTDLDGTAKGSARSIKDFDIHTALKKCERHIEQFGGHKYAAGLSIRTSEIDAFRASLNDYALTTISDEMLTPQLMVDAEAELDELTPRFFHLISQFAPFGPHNSRPHFMTRGVEVVGHPRVVGRDHLKFRVRNGAGFLEAIAFGLGGRSAEMRSGTTIDIVFNVEQNEYRGAVTPQLRVLDFRAADPNAGPLAISRPYVSMNGTTPNGRANGSAPLNGTSAMNSTSSAASVEENVLPHDLPLNGVAGEG